MSQENALKEFIEKEEKSSIYSYKIDGITLYPLIRRDVRASYLISKGFEQMEMKLGIDSKAAFFTIIISFLQILKLFFYRKKVKKIIHCFSRVERVGDYYIDKFSDPVCKLTKLADNAIIFCKSFGGVRRKPRLYSNKIIYIDFIFLVQKLCCLWRMKNINKSELIILENLSNEIESFNDCKYFNQKYLWKSLLMRIYSVKLFSFIYKQLGVEKIYLLPRNPAYVYAAHLIGKKVYEFQHGITYGVNNIYSGRCLPEYTPDYFLAFGDAGPRDVYGIDRKKIITIGWAFDEYVKKEKVLTNITDKDILIICDPAITDILLSVILEFAENMKEIQFHFRPHPNQKMNTSQLQLMDKFPNLHLQDNKINSNIVLSCFTHIIGENSTVLYEALSMGKKVGKLFYPGLNSRYLNDFDKSFFYEINSISDLNFFLNDKNKKDVSFSIYTPFNKKNSYIFE